MSIFHVTRTEPSAGAASIAAAAARGAKERRKMRGRVFYVWDRRTGAIAAEASDAITAREQARTCRRFAGGDSDRFYVEERDKIVLDTRLLLRAGEESRAQSAARPWWWISR